LCSANRTRLEEHGPCEMAFAFRSPLVFDRPLPVGDRGPNGVCRKARGRTSCGSLRFEIRDLRPVERPPDDRLKSLAGFDVDLPKGPFRVCPMGVWLIKDHVSSPAGPGQLAVPYTAQPFVQGYAQLPNRTLLVRLEYDFDDQGYLA
jgi:hypothetical protein